MIVIDLYNRPCRGLDDNFVLLRLFVSVCVKVCSGLREQNRDLLPQLLNSLNLVEEEEEKEESLIPFLETSSQVE